MKTRNLFMTMAIATALFSCKKGVEDIDTEGAKITVTGQSVMVDVKATGNFLIQDNEVWEFDESAAAVLFGYNSCNPATSGQLNGNSCRNAAVSDARAAKCSLWLADKQFWTMKQNPSTGGMVKVPVNINMAALSYVKNNTFPLGKYSFSLGTNELPRITNLKYSINGVDQGALPFVITSGCADATIGENLYDAYDQGFGVGATTVLGQNGKTVTDILSQNSKSKSLCPNADWAKAHFNLELGAGDYDIVISGTFKGNDGMGNSTFSVTKKVHISNQNCD
jgi:hypothetical protein